MLNPQNFIMMPIPASAYTAVCALLGGALVMAPEGTRGSTETEATAQEIPGVKSVSSIEEDAAAYHADLAAATLAGDAEIDAHGHPWSDQLHASTKGKTKDGLWRMKVGVSRPDPLPGFPIDNAASGEATGTSSGTDQNSATSQTATGSASAPAVTSGDEDDEFAAFRNAAAESSATDAAAAASVPVRNFSDADLGALCNQAAVKLGDPSPVKEIIAQYVPAGEVAHSRNIPADKREEFAKAVEAKAGISFAG